MPHIRNQAWLEGVSWPPTDTRRSSAVAWFLRGRADYRRSESWLKTEPEESWPLGCPRTNRKTIARGLVSPQIAGGSR